MKSVSTGGVSIAYVPDRVDGATVGPFGTSETRTRAATQMFEEGGQFEEGEKQALEALAWGGSARARERTYTASEREDALRRVAETAGRLVPSKREREAATEQLLKEVLSFNRVAAIRTQWLNDIAPRVGLAIASTAVYVSEHDEGVQITDERGKSLALVKLTYNGVERRMEGTEPTERNALTAVVSAALRELVRLENGEKPGR